MSNSVEMPTCGQCPTAHFDFNYIGQNRYMAICHAKECVLQPKFPNNSISDSKLISKANIQSVIFEPLENCPHIQKLRNEGFLPWAVATIDFSKPE